MTRSTPGILAGWDLHSLVSEHNTLHWVTKDYNSQWLVCIYCWLGFSDHEPDTRTTMRYPLDDGSHLHDELMRPVDNTIKDLAVAGHQRAFHTNKSRRWQGGEGGRVWRRLWKIGFRASRPDGQPSSGPWGKNISPLFVHAFHLYVPNIVDG